MRDSSRWIIHTPKTLMSSGLQDSNAPSNCSPMRLAPLGGVNMP